MQWKLLSVQQDSTLTSLLFNPTFFWLLFKPLRVPFLWRGNGLSSSLPFCDLKRPKLCVWQRAGAMLISGSLFSLDGQSRRSREITRLRQWCWVPSFSVYFQAIIQSTAIFVMTRYPNIPALSSSFLQGFFGLIRNSLSPQRERERLLCRLIYIRIDFCERLFSSILTTMTLVAAL